MINQVKDYKSAYEPWKEVFTKHPIARYQMYSEGRTILKNLLNKEKDESFDFHLFFYIQGFVLLKRIYNFAVLDSIHKLILPI